jgi:hypothetical protein
MQGWRIMTCLRLWTFSVGLSVTLLLLQLQAESKLRRGLSIHAGRHLCGCPRMAGRMP